MGNNVKQVEKDKVISKKIKYITKKLFTSWIKRSILIIRLGFYFDW